MTPAPSPRVWRAGLLLLLLLTAAVFLPGLGGEFVFDDQNLIVQNTLTGSLASLPALFQVSLWSTCPAGADDAGMYYRPLMLVSLALDRALFGLSPAWARLHSLGWHLLAVGLLAHLLRQRLRLPAAAALLGTALFALHPAQVEGVLFVSARNDLMAAVGVLLALLALGRDQPAPRHLALGGAATLLAMLSKESAALAPVFLLLWEQARAGRWGGWRAHAAVLAGLGGALGLRALAGVGAPAGADPAHLLAALLPSAGRYAHVLLWPVDLVPGYHLLYMPGVAWGALGGLGLLLGAALWLGRRPALAGVAWAAAAAAPTLPAVAHTATVPDRYLYLPLAGLGLTLAAAAARWPARAQQAAAALAALLLAILSARTVPTWADDVTLWSQAAVHLPSPYTFGGLAKVLEQRGVLDAAAEAYTRAVVPPHPFAHSCWNVSAIHLKRGDPLAAGEAGLRGLEAGCAPSAELLAPAALGFALAGRWEDAELLALQVEADPTGKAVLVRLAAAARRDDLAPLLAAADAEAGGLERLAPMVAAVLEQGGAPQVAARVRALIP